MPSIIQYVILEKFWIISRANVKLKRNQQKKGMDSFFVISDQLFVEDEKEYETVKFESLKGKEKDIQVDISAETPKSKNIKTPSPSVRVEDFAAQ